MEWKKITPWLIAAPSTEANTVAPVMTAEVPEASGDLIGAALARAAHDKKVTITAKATKGRRSHYSN